jgi:hypothetical protein
VELCGNFRGSGLGVLSCSSFFTFFLRLVVSLFADSERVLFLIGYGTPWVLFWVCLISLFWGSWMLLSCRNVNNLPSCPLPILNFKALIVGFYSGNSKSFSYCGRSGSEYYYLSWKDNLHYTNYFLHCQEEGINHKERKANAA